MTVAAVGTLLGVSTDTVNRYDAAARIPRPIHLSDSTRRWRARELLDWIDVGCPHRDKWERNSWTPSHMVKVSWLLDEKKREVTALHEECRELLDILKQGQELVRVRT